MIRSMIREACNRDNGRYRGIIRDVSIRIESNRNFERRDCGAIYIRAPEHRLSAIRANLLSKNNGATLNKRGGIKGSGYQLQRRRKPR